MKIIGINALVRETIHSYNSRDIYVKLRQHSTSTRNNVGSLTPMTQRNPHSGEELELLIPQSPTPIVYDQTHDNECYLQTHGISQCLSLIGLNCFLGILGCFIILGCYVGTVYGFDCLYTKKVCVVAENRLYHVENHENET